MKNGHVTHRRTKKAANKEAHGATMFGIIAKKHIL